MSLQTDLIEKWKHVLDATKHIYTKTGDGELCYWTEEASKVKVAIEVGTLFGRSAKMMLLGNPELWLVCYDPFYQDGTYETAKYFLSEEIDRGRCNIIRGKSDRAKELFHPDEVGFIMIDGSHDEVDVLGDLNNLYPFLKRGGLICGHDLDRNPDNGVTKAVKLMFPDFDEPVPRVWAYRKP